jgi:hypothetical protein
MFLSPFRSYLKTTQTGIFDLWNPNPEENSNEKEEKKRGIAREKSPLAQVLLQTNVNFL